MRVFGHLRFGAFWALLVVVHPSCMGCGDPVDCGSVCETALECEVTFDAPDDPDEEKIESGERSDLESCIMGCNQSELVTPASADCIEALDTENTAACQEATLECLEVVEAT